MQKVLLCFIVLCFFANADVNAQTNVKAETSKTVTLNTNQSTDIDHLISADTAFKAGYLNLQTEILKFSPNLIYKYRLDSISSNIHFDYNSHVQTYIDVFTTKRKSEMAKMLGLGHYYFPIFEKALSAYKIPEEFKYLPIIESSMNPMAVSRTGATGLWQFTFNTGKDYGLANDEFVDERRDPINSSYAAAAYLRDAYNEFGDWLLALAAYNCGGGTVRRAILKVGNKPSFWDIQEHLPAETRNYVPAFIAANYMMKYYTKHDVKIIEEAYIQTDSVYVNKYVSFKKIAQSLNMDTSDLQSLNPSYKKSIINGSLNTPKRLIIPKIAAHKFSNFFEVLNSEEEQNFKTEATIEIHPEEKSESPAASSNKAEPEGNSSNKTEPSYFNYKVKAGDTLTDIAERFGNVTINSLKELNQLKTSLLTIGSVLKIYLL